VRWPQLCGGVAETFTGVPDGRHAAHTLRLLAHFLDPQLACAAQGQSPDPFDIW
jgi:hypothetical protein